MDDCRWGVFCAGFVGGAVMSAHTPGPWIIRKGNEWTRDVVTDHGELPDGRRNYWNVASANIHREECSDNLLLIAAAPDLLDACLTLLAWDEAENNAEAFDKDQGKAWRERQALCAASFDKARAAIAKATGAAS